MNTIDQIDRKILKIVQHDNRLSNDELAEKVNLSSSAVRRRLRRLRECGVILKEVAILEPASFGISVIVSIRLASETHSIYEAFKQRMLAAQEVAQCYTVSGEADLIVIAHLKDLPSYERWMDEHVLSDDSVQRADTNIVYSRIKYETAIHIDVNQ